MNYFPCGLRGGGGYSETVLSDTPILLPDNDYVILSDDFDKFDVLRFDTTFYDSVLYNHTASIYVPKDLLIKSFTDYNNPEITYSFKGRFEVARRLDIGPGYSMNWQLIAAEKNKIICGAKSTVNWASNLCYIFKIVGIKYG